MLAPIVLAFTVSVPVPVSTPCSLDNLAAPEAMPQIESDVQAPPLESKVVGRTRQRVTYFGRDRKRPSPGQVSLEFGRLKFVSAADANAGKDGAAGGGGSKSADGRWAAGIDYWSALDINTNMKFGGKSVAPGHYYVLVDRKGSKWKLVLLDAEKLRQKQVSFAAAAATKGGIVIPLKQEELSGKPRNLSMTMGFVDRQNAPEKLKFSLQWGGHAYTAPVKLKSMGQVMPFMQSEKRSRSILQRPGASAKGTAAVVVIEHSLPKHKPVHEKRMQGMKSGQRWRFGQNFWSSFESNVPVTIGKKKVAPGYYYLMLEKGEEGKWSLVLLDHGKARKKTMDAFQAMATKDGIEVGLQTEASSDKEQKELSVTMEAGEGQKATLHIRWGKYHLTAPMQVH